MSKKLFCFGLCAMLFALCFPAEAQQAGKVHRIGFLRHGTPPGTASLLEAFRQGLRDLKILKGTKPADLPVEQPRKVKLWVNLKTAKQIGLTIPYSVLIRADKVIK